MANHLGMTRSMLDKVRKGDRNLSFQALERLEEAERAAGIAPPAGFIELPNARPITVPSASKEKLKSFDSVEFQGEGGGTRDERIAEAIATIRAGLDVLEKALRLKS